MSDYTIECQNLTKKYGDVAVVKDINLRFEKGKLHMLIGPSGCGKTTLLKMCNRLVEKSFGNIIFEGETVDKINPISLRRSIGYVIQETGLFPHYTIYDNIAVVPRLLRWSEKKISERVDELMELVNLDSHKYLDKYPKQLSGGQRQRIGVARALAANPDVLLMDEPFGAIDPINREQLQNGFLEIQQRIQKTVIFVTHDIREAIKLGDTISILRQGSLIQHGETSSVINNPADEFVEDLLGADRAMKGLELLRVKDFYSSNFLHVTQDDQSSAAQLLEKMGRRGRMLIVCDKKNRLAGYISRKDLQRHRDASHLDSLIKPIESIQPYGNLLEAVSLMMSSGLPSVPVVDDHNKMLGLIHFTDLIEQLGSVAEEKEEEGCL